MYGSMIVTTVSIIDHSIYRYDKIGYASSVLVQAVQAMPLCKDD